MRTQISLLTFLSFLFNNDERQAAIGALAVAGTNRKTAGRAFALSGQFVGSANLGMHFHEVFLNFLMRPFKVLRRYDQTTCITAAAFLTACIGTLQQSLCQIEPGLFRLGSPYYKLSKIAMPSLTGPQPFVYYCDEDHFFS